MTKKQWTLDEINKRYNEIITSHKKDSVRNSIPENATSEEDNKIIEVYNLFHPYSCHRKR